MRLLEILRIWGHSGPGMLGKSRIDSNSFSMGREIFGVDLT